jgi:DNA-binding NarL/FixJ family response regulator
LLHITPWERAALQCLSEGKSPAQLALLFGMPVAELERQLSALFSRMGAASPTDAVAAACKRGLIPAAPTPAASRL